MTLYGSHTFRTYFYLTFSYLGVFYPRRQQPVPLTLTPYL